MGNLDLELLLEEIKKFFNKEKEKEEYKESVKMINDKMTDPMLRKYNELVYLVGLKEMFYLENIEKVEKEDLIRITTTFKTIGDSLLQLGIFIFNKNKKEEETENGK